MFFQLTVCDAYYCARTLISAGPKHLRLAAVTLCHFSKSSFVSYLVCLLQENQQIIHEKLQYGDFGIMTHTLEKFLAFMNMTVSVFCPISTVYHCFSAQYKCLSSTRLISFQFILYYFFVYYVISYIKPCIISYSIVLYSDMYHMYYTVLSHFI